jgi:hypothetical protein
MTSIIVINLLLGFFDIRLFFDEDYIKFLKYKNSIIKIECVIPEMKYEFYKRVSKEEKKEKIYLFTMEKPKPIYPKRQIEMNKMYGHGSIINFPENKQRMRL